jgi:NAD-dependent dihydropyrimidine dehydrogenase PreA subunit
MPPHGRALIGLCAIALLPGVLWGVAGVQAQGDGDPQAGLVMPFEQFAQTRGVDPAVLARELGLPPDADLKTPLGRLMKEHKFGRPEVQEALQRLKTQSPPPQQPSAAVPAAVTPPAPLAEEAASKDWRKIRIKFALWVAVFIAAMVLLSRTKITRRLRATMMLLAAAVFGLWLGVEPNAPGTVKDALVLYGQTGLIFPPRMIALVAFLLMSIIGNKVFCGWGCQFGTLQDLVWHLPTRKVKPPLWLSNTVRVAWFAAVAVAALAVRADIMEAVDPFRIFRLGALSAVIVACAVLVIGVWVYRPWCTFMCPFGLVSWLGERVSLWRPRVNHETCINCKACERACPTHSMEGIRARSRTPQDCFACGACVRVCPAAAVAWALRPPPSEPSPEEQAP